ncbi:type I restriction-modification system subunit M [Leptospira ilyithenensis]|uniref:site-specific DNA-methyltransferase (adenine-specific) n=1 Tax=Leptospira ilyithenensis TaxID=2484901 RepID=A0A4R9LVU0_9LEPT|nr:class I SAM-dependent DNA methyltransferase [Leptospira ilyithenensis]TGN14006.1 SAM-dependent DNA methyltransferase [Leptospira ilyithenensis]
MAKTQSESFSSIASFIWSVADTLRGDFRQSEYGRIILPMTVLRRLECVLEATREDVIIEMKKHKGSKVPLQPFLEKASGFTFYNTSNITLERLGTNDTKSNLETYVESFSENVSDIFQNFNFQDIIDRLHKANLLFHVCGQFASVDLHPKVVDNHQMGLIFEELIRKFAESSNETAGDHFTPRDIVRLITSLLFCNDSDALTKPGIIRSVYDPTAGTGGLLSSSSEYIFELNPKARIINFGQELNAESYAICKADMLIKGQDVKNIKLGNTLSDDQHAGAYFDYSLSNPPFGVDWKKVEKQIYDEHKKKGYSGRFGAGLPRVSDGSLLFLMHLISKMTEPSKGGSRIGIILNGSPLFTGGAGSGESEIRRYVLENDLVEAIVALPTDMFYNTGIATYIWILSNHKDKVRLGKVQLINANSEEFCDKMRKSLGSKRKYMTEKHIEEIVKIYGSMKVSKVSKIFKNTDFGYRRITVERPLKLSFLPKDEIKLSFLKEDSTFGKLDKKEQKLILDGLSTLNERYDDRELFLKDLKAKIKLTPAIEKLIVKTFGEQDETAKDCKNAKGEIEADSDLRDSENVPLGENIETYFKREVLPHVPNAWIDTTKRDEKDNQVGIVGYEIPFNRHFYEYKPPRELKEIDADLDKVTKEILDLLQEVHS